MSIQDEVYSLKAIKKGVVDCLKITLVFGVLFGVVFGERTIEAILGSFLISGLYSFGLGFGNGFINNYLSLKWNWITQTNQRVWAGIIGTILYTIPAVLAINYMVFVVINGLAPYQFFSQNYIFIHLFYIILSLGVSTFFHARGFMMKWKVAMTRKSDQQEIVAKTETAKFESLKNQIDPHFLFNSLNVLTSLISEAPLKAEKFTTKLSKIYRYVLEQRNKDLVPIQEELQFAKAYVALLGMRFEDAVQFSIPEEVSNEALKIVPLSLQLLLENAVKHNVVSSAKPLKITIEEANGFLHISNNVNPKETLGKSTKVGLQNIVDRYGLISEKKVIITHTKNLFKVSLPLLTNINIHMETPDFENSAYIKAVEKVEKLKEFYRNLVSFCIVIPFLIYINFRFVPQFHWFWFVIFGWGIGLVFHFLEVNNYTIFLGNNWEERKIKEMMKKDTNSKKHL